MPKIIEDDTLRKDKVLSLRVSVEEYNELSRQAREIGMTLSTYINNLLFPDSPICRTKAKIVRKKNQPIISIENTVNTNEIPFVVFQSKIEYPLEL